MLGGILDHLGDIYHFLPTLLLSAIIWLIAYFILRKRKRGKLLAFTIASFIGYFLYLNSDAYLNARRYYKWHKTELYEAIDMFKKTTQKVPYYMWLGKDKKHLRIECKGDTSICKGYDFGYYSDVDAKKRFLQKAGLSEQYMDSLITLLYKNRYKEITTSRKADSNPNDPYYIVITYKSSLFLQSYLYKYLFIQNSFDDLNAKDKAYPVDKGVYFWKTVYKVI